MTEQSRISRAAGIIGKATMASRVLGYVRDAVMAGFFGAGMGADAFFVAFRIPNLLRRLFAEGSLTVAFVPVFTERMEKQGKEDAFRMAGASFWLLGLILAAITILGVVYAPWVVRVVAPGFAKDPEKLALTVMLTRFCFPYAFFICLVALCMGILNSLNHFLAPALAPVLLNGAMILSILTLTGFMEPPAAALAVGVLGGGFLQLALQVPFLREKGFFVWRFRGLWHPAIKKVALLMGPAVFGAAVYQVNILVGTLLASLLPPGSVSYLYYADRLVQLPLGVFGVAVAMALLPSLSRQAAKDDMAGFKDSFAHSMGLIAFIMLPAAVGLILLAEPIIGVLFQRGEFGVEDTRMTAQALVFYALGLGFFSAVRIVVSAFYALQDTKTPVKAAVISMAANAVFSLALMGPMGIRGLALSTTLASGLNLFLLGFHLKRRLGLMGGRAILASIVRSGLGALAMGAAVWAASQWLLVGQPWPLFQWAWRLCFLIVLGGAVYAGVTRVIARQEFSAALAMVKRKTGR